MNLKELPLRVLLSFSLMRYVLSPWWGVFLYLTFSSPSKLLNSFPSPYLRTELLKYSPLGCRYSPYYLKYNLPCFHKYFFIMGLCFSCIPLWIKKLKHSKKLVNKVNVWRHSKIVPQSFPKYITFLFPIIIESMYNLIWLIWEKFFRRMERRMGKTKEKVSWCLLNSILSMIFKYVIARFPHTKRLNLNLNTL